MSFFLRVAVGVRDVEVDPKVEGSSLEEVSWCAGQGGVREGRSGDSRGGDFARAQIELP